jgi:hypothetical protein
MHMPVVVLLPSANIQTKYVKCRPGHIRMGCNKHLASSVPVLHKAVNTRDLSWWQGQTLTCAWAHAAVHLDLQLQSHISAAVQRLNLVSAHCLASATPPLPSVILRLAEIMLMLFCTLNVCKVQFLTSWKCGCTVLKDWSVQGLATTCCDQLQIK